MIADGDEAARERLAAIGQISVEIAHELSNLLQVISSSAFLARQEFAKDDPSAASPHVAKIEKSARTAHAVVDDLMAIARGEPPARESVSLADVLAAARADFLPGAAQWHDAIDPPDLRALVRAGLLARLLHALYDNAIQASAPRTPLVATRARAEPGRVVIEVHDDGPGVSEAIAARVFDPLVTARAGGTGLGLSLARRIAAAHGGSIALVAAGDEGGATFRVEFPDG